MTTEDTLPLTGRHCFFWGYYLNYKGIKIIYIVQDKKKKKNQSQRSDPKLMRHTHNYNLVINDVQFKYIENNGL